MNKPLFRVENLKKYFPITSGIFRREIGNIKAVDDISFSLDQKEVLGIVGESGSGKSTAARASIRLIEPTEGEIYFEEENLLALNKTEMQYIRKEIQMVFQDPYASLNPRQTVGESIGEALLYHRMVSNRSEQRQEVAAVLEQIGLSSDVMDRYPHQFSGGQQQRLCIGRAIAMKPKMIICDEAVSALDVSVQAQILNLLVELQEKLGLSYLFISHDLSIVRHICDRVVVMHKGKIVEQGTVEDIFNDPKNPYTQTLLKAIPKRHPSH